MTEQVKDQNDSQNDSKNVNQNDSTSKKYQLFAEPRGRYTLIDGNKVFHFNFPQSASLAENYGIISYIKEEIWKTLEKQKEEEKSKIIKP